MDGSPLRSRGLAADPEKLAEHAIRLLDTRLREDHGVRVRMGMELEYLIEFRDDAPTMAIPGAGRDPLQLGSDGSGTLFPHSRFLETAYRERHYADAIPSIGQKALRQYEVTSDYRHPMPLDRLPRAIAATREELVGTATARASAPRTPEGVGATRARQRRWYGANVSDIRFDTSPKHLIPSGLHLNFSLHDPATDAPILQGTEGLVKTLANRTRDLFDREQGLLVDTMGQHIRWRSTTSGGRPDIVTRAVQPGNMVHEALNHVPPGHHCYIENKAPGADCNPHYAVLLQMAAIYAGMTGMQDAGLRTILDQLEPGLGTRFIDAEQAVPERRSYHSLPSPEATIRR